MFSIRRALDAVVARFPSHSPHDLAARNWVGIEQVRALYRYCLPGVFAAGFAGLVLTAALAAQGRVDLIRAVVWAVILIVGDLFHLRLCHLYWRADPSNWELWRDRFALIALVQGGTWGLGAIWLTSPHDITQELIVALSSGMVALAAVPIYGRSYRVYLVFMIPAILPHLAYGVFYDTPFHSILAALVAAYLITVPFIARVSNMQFLEGLHLRFENLALIENLSKQKELADAANRAKSSFLASASHDLRQPIHAMGMFIGALRAQTMSSEARRLVEHIGSSINAMDDLFAALLDISKLDAGVVTARLDSVRLSPLLRRLCHDYSEDAVAKGISFHLVPTSAVVISDPVLLERILRNLLSNAVRYTDSGRVTVGCRRLHNGVRVEIWDTGRGIAPEQHTQIFEEFYQIGNPERDRSKGLGLGLAIVQRIVPLVGAQLTLKSALGRGSVFGLWLPRAIEGQRLTRIPEPELLGATRRGLIVVIDDEIAIQNAMSSLLSSWGHRTIIAGSGDEVLGLLDLQTDPPDLIICDYRLRHGESGLDVIGSLRAAYQVAIPALLITGDTAPDRIREAHNHSALVLHKPLSNSKLRAAIGNSMRGAPLNAPIAQFLQPVPDQKLPTP